MFSGKHSFLEFVQRVWYKLLAVKVKGSRFSPERRGNVRDEKSETENQKLEMKNKKPPPEKRLLYV